MPLCLVRLGSGTGTGTRVSSSALMLSGYNSTVVRRSKAKTTCYMYDDDVCMKLGAAELSAAACSLQSDGGCRLSACVRAGNRVQ
jgi:hypothetical protein